MEDYYKVYVVWENNNFALGISPIAKMPDGHVVYEYWTKDLSDAKHDLQRVYNLISFIQKVV